MAAIEAVRDGEGVHIPAGGGNGGVSAQAPFQPHGGTRSGRRERGTGGDEARRVPSPGRTAPEGILVKDGDDAVVTVVVERATGGDEVDERAAVEGDFQHASVEGFAINLEVVAVPEGGLRVRRGDGEGRGDELAVADVVWVRGKGGVGQRVALDRRGGPREPHAGGGSSPLRRQRGRGHAVKVLHQQRHGPAQWQAEGDGAQVAQPVLQQKGGGHSAAAHAGRDEGEGAGNGNTAAAECAVALRATGRGDTTGREQRGHQIGGGPAAGISQGEVERDIFAGVDGSVRRGAAFCQQGEAHGEDAHNAGVHAGDAGDTAVLRVEPVAKTRGGGAAAGPREGEFSIAVRSVRRGAKRIAAGQRADHPVRHRIPDARAGGAGLGDTVVPDHLPVRAEGALTDATVHGGEGRAGETDGLLVAVGMMDADGARRRHRGAIPAGVIHVETALRHVLQLDQSEVHIRLGGAEDDAALVLRERTATELATDRRLIIPIDHDAGGVAGGDAAMVGSEEIILLIARRVVDECAGAERGS